MDHLLPILEALQHAANITKADEPVFWLPQPGVHGKLVLVYPADIKLLLSKIIVDVTELGL